MIAEIDRGLALIDQRFTELASNGDERANHFLDSLTRARTELDALAAQASSQDDAIGSLAERTAALRESIDRLTGEIRDGVGTAIGEAQGGADRLAEAASACRPEIGWMRDAAVEASERMSATGDADRRAAGPLRGAARQRRRRRRRRPVEADRARLDARRRSSAKRRSLSAETGPALVAALVQVKEAAGARRRARPRSDRGGHPGKRRQAVRGDPRGARARDPREHRGAAARGRERRRARGRSRRARRPTG